MPARVLRAIHHTCHPKAASCLRKASFAFHQLHSPSSPYLLYGALAFLKRA